MTELPATFLAPAQPPVISKPAPSLHAIKPMDSACVFSTCANLQVRSVCGVGGVGWVWPSCCVGGGALGGVAEQKFSSFIVYSIKTFWVVQIREGSSCSPQARTTSGDVMTMDRTIVVCQECHEELVRIMEFTHFCRPLATL